MNTLSRTQLLGMNCQQMEEHLLQMGQPRFRGRQIYKWIYQKDVSSFYEMSDIPKELRQQLDETSVISIPRVLKQRVSKDGTRKFLMEFEDRKRIETVVIPQVEEREARYSLCISTQVGCPIGCAFCATGSSGYQRSLQSYEMVGQFLSSRRELRRRLKKSEDSLISNVVYMGMGEPFLNYDQVIASVYLLIDPKGINIGQRHITISTSGEAKGIKRLAEENLQVTLAISLHATDDHLRDQLVPLNRKYPLGQLLEAVDYYIKKTNRRVTFEYVMLDEVNISRKHANQLVKMVKPLLANINLIPYNEVETLPFKRPSSNKVWQFYYWLVEEGLNVTIREERGGDIEAACGQLCAKER